MSGRKKAEKIEKNYQVESISKREFSNRLYYGELKNYGQIGKNESGFRKGRI